MASFLLFYPYRWEALIHLLDMHFSYSYLKLRVVDWGYFFEKVLWFLLYAWLNISSVLSLSLFFSARSTSSWPEVDDFTWLGFTWPLCPWWWLPAAKSIQMPSRHFIIPYRPITITYHYLLKMTVKFYSRTFYGYENVLSCDHNP